MVQEKHDVKKATLVILTFNEIGGIKEIYNKIPFDKFDEVFAVDPGSTDGTLDFYKEKNIRVLLQEKKGRGEAFRLAIDNARNDILVFFSPDGNEDPNDSVKLVGCIEGGADMAIASRFTKQSRAADDELIKIRGFGNKFFTKVANVLFGGNLSDSINGYRAISKEKFLKLNPDAQGFCIEYQMSMRAMKLGYKIVEIPTIEGDRISGGSKHNSFRTGMKFFKLIGKEFLNRKKFLFS